MSRIGKMPVVIPSGVKATVSGQAIHVEGPKGKLTQSIDDLLNVKIVDGKILIAIEKERPESGARHGLLRSHVANMVEGVSTGFTKNLEINGVGFRANLKGRELELSLGFSHPILYKIPEGINIVVDKQVKLAIMGANLQLVGQTAAEIRSFRKPEPYKGKGIKYAEEKIRRKAGKAAASSAS